MESLEEKVARVVKEQVELVEYDPAWPTLYEQERQHLASCASPGLIRRIEHCGSTSVPHMVAKPIIDMLVEVTDLERARVELVPSLDAQGYDCFERPTRDQAGDPTYPWIIRRDADGYRTHHIHMVDDAAEHAHHRDKLVFRDHLLSHPGSASAYANLKRELAAQHRGDRVAYTRAKAEFVASVLALAKQQNRSC